MSTQKPIYLDYLSTTPIAPEVGDAMLSCMGREGVYGNSASTDHAYGWAAADKVEQARQQVAATIHADPREIVFTSGATESINLALQGVAKFYARNGKHIVTLQTEHKATLDTCDYLASAGFEITRLRPAADGTVALDEIAGALRPDTILFSCVWVNNELGTIMPIQEIASVCRSSGVLCHVDAAQAIGKVDVNVERAHVDLMSLSAHKVYGPKGVGALYVRRQPRVRLTPMLYGGDHEHGVRAGTVATHQVVGMGQAYAMAQSCLLDDSTRITDLQEKLWSGLSMLEGVTRHRGGPDVVPHVLNVHVDGVDGEALLLALKDCAVSSGSACNSATLEPSHVLLACGKTRLVASQSLRISLGRYTTAEEIDRVVEHIKTEVTRLRGLWSDDSSE